MLRLTRFQWLVHLSSWIPFVVLLFDYFQKRLTVNPIQAVEQRTGQIAITLLVISLSCTPIHTILGFRPALKVRRALGLYAFFYASLHFLAFFWWDYGANLSFIWLDVGNKLYIFVGAVALIILIPLALTSTRGMMRRLGQRWRKLHRLIYFAGILAVFHYIWAVKADIRIPLAYGAVLCLLYILRLPPVRRLIARYREAFIPHVRRWGAVHPPAPEIK